ncbi:MAG: hypothetical protein IPH07_34140 [Deltaproteobacteria bacterium]|nr:hypothetical protein [Deltaproteobacteria bacterium]MBK8716460.1 hypothetical protein [Deltaproteobacteria bacterium]MBP7287351.1 hypothetical protein [Nannocystaceae bacterium]
MTSSRLRVSLLGLLVAACTAAPAAPTTTSSSNGSSSGAATTAAGSSEGHGSADSTGTNDDGVDGSHGDSGTSSGSDSGGVEQHPAVAAFWVAFLAEDYAAVPELIAQLDAAALEHPDDPEIALIRAHANLWRLAEFERDPGQGGAVQAMSAMAAIEAFTTARALAPDDGRIPCWLGIVEINTGTVIGDAAMIAQGHADVDASVESFPEFSLFCRMLEYENEPYDSAEFQLAVDALWQTLDLCFGESVDRQAPELSAYLDQQTDAGPKRVCWNLHPKAVHNWQGFLLHAGDVIAKTGDAEVASILYEDAQLLDWRSWPHQDLVDERLADVVDRAASYADADPMNDAEIGSGVYNCAMCHGE